MLSLEILCHHIEKLTYQSKYVFFSYSILLMCSYLCTHFICIMIQWLKHKIVLLFYISIIYLSFTLTSTSWKRTHILVVKMMRYVWYIWEQRDYSIYFGALLPPLSSQSHKIPKSFKYGLEWDWAVGNFQIWIYCIP